MQKSPFFLFAPALLLPLVSCFQSSSDSGTATGGATGGGGLGPVFSGVISADPISNSSILVTWAPAVDPNTGLSSGLTYRVFRSSDPISVLGNAEATFETPPDVTSFIDESLAPFPFSAVYYRVEALNSSGAISSNSVVTSAFLPSTFLPGTVYYDVDVEPFWSMQFSNGAPNCISCHDGSIQSFDLTSYNGLMTGGGTAQNPDTFIIPYDGEGTWNELVFRLVSNPLEHMIYWPVASEMVPLKDSLEAWVQEGALKDPDSFPPIFRFSDVTNAGKYHGRFVDFQTAEVTFFHADDPESLPFSGSTAGQLEYLVFAGPNSANIDWLNPVASMFGLDNIANPSMSQTFTWTDSSLSMVVKALDPSGRLVEVPDVTDPSYLDQLALRRRNMSLGETEITLNR